MADRADFAAAVRALAADELELAGDHPPGEEISAYAAGTVVAARADELRAHFARCPDCAGLVLDFAEFQPAPAVGRHEREKVAAAYAHLGRRLGLSAAGGDPSPIAAPGSAWMPWLLAAATLAAAVLGVWAWRQDRALEELRRPRVNVASVDLDPKGSDAVRGGDVSRPVDLSSGATLYLALPGVNEDRPLRLVVVDDRERQIWELSGARLEPELNNLALYLPPGSLAPGRYQLRVFTDESSSAVAVYRLAILKSGR